MYTTQIINRIFYYQQVGGLIGFQYIYNIAVIIRFRGPAVNFVSL